MNILQITASDSGIGGASRIALDLHHGMKDKGHLSTIIAGTNLSSDSSILHIEKTFFQKGASWISASDVDFWNSDKILDFNEYKNADIIHLHNIHGYWFNLSTLKKICREKPVVWTLHDMWAVTPHCAHSPFLEPINGFYPCRSRKDYPNILWHNEKYLMRKKREAYESSDFTTVSPSEWLSQKVEKSVLKDKSIRVIPNGIDTSLYLPDDKRKSREKLNLPVHKKIVLFIAAGGIKNEFKGGKEVLKLANRYTNRDDILFVVIGETDKKYEEEYRNLVIYPQIGKKEELATFYNASDALLFPSYRENFPLVILEAMACDIPVVAYDVGGIKESLEHKITGYIARYRDQKDLAAGLEYVLHTHFKSDTIRKRSIERFSLAKMIDRYEELYGDMLP